MKVKILLLHLVHDNKSFTYKVLT